VSLRNNLNSTLPSPLLPRTNICKVAAVCLSVVITPQRVDPKQVRADPAHKIPFPKTLSPRGLPIRRNQRDALALRPHLTTHDVYVILVAGHKRKYDGVFFLAFSVGYSQRVLPKQPRTPADACDAYPQGTFRL
jgi:hypothetical protein